MHADDAPDDQEIDPNIAAGHGSFSLRDYRPADAPALARLFRTAIMEIGAAAYSPAQCSAWATAADDLPAFTARLQDYWIRVAEDDDAIAEGAAGGDACIGFAAIEPQGKTAHIAMLFVAPGYTRLGVASALCDELNDLAAAMGARTLTTDASLIAREFFLQRGFKDLGVEEVERNGVTLPRHRMQKG